MAARRNTTEEVTEIVMNLLCDCNKSELSDFEGLEETIRTKWMNFLMGATWKPTMTWKSTHQLDMEMFSGVEESALFLTLRKWMEKINDPLRLQLVKMEEGVQVAINGDQKMRQF